MANNFYVVNSSGGTGSPTPTLTDDGTGIDEIRIIGTFSLVSEINLSWTGSPSPSARGFYWVTGPSGNNQHALIVNGMIENARGSDSADFISGNLLANTIFGDFARSGAGGNDTLSGGEGNDTIYGGNGNDRLDGMEDNDVLFGDAGNDMISGGSGVDAVQGGLGADILSGGASLRDLVSYSESNAAVNIRITYGATTTGIGGHAAGDTINGFTDVTGSNFNDLITDTVKGNISFNSNQNIFRGGGGADTLVLGGGNDLGYGGIGNDALYGEAGNDSLFGEAGNDILLGGAGNDALYGGAGIDQFRFNAGLSTTNVDRIADFSVPQDTIWLDNALMPGLGVATGFLAAAKFWKSTAGVAHDADDRIIYDTDNGLLFYDANGTGAGSRTLFARIAPGLLITNADFFVF